MQSVYMFSRMSNLIYLLPVTYLTVWLLIGSHSATSRRVWYYLSELILAGIKTLPKAKGQTHMCILFVSPFEVLHLHLVPTQRHVLGHRALPDSALKGNTACRGSEQQWP